MLIDGVQTVLFTSDTISSFGVDQSGEFYLVNLNGSVRRVVRP